MREIVGIVIAAFTLAFYLMPIHGSVFLVFPILAVSMALFAYAIDRASPFDGLPGPLARITASPAQTSEESRRPSKDGGRTLFQEWAVEEGYVPLPRRTVEFDAMGGKVAIALDGEGDRVGLTFDYTEEPNLSMGFDVFGALAETVPMNKDSAPPRGVQQICSWGTFSLVIRDYDVIGPEEDRMSTPLVAVPVGADELGANLAVRSNDVKKAGLFLTKKMAARLAWMSEAYGPVRLGVVPCRVHGRFTRAPSTLQGLSDLRDGCLEIVGVLRHPE